MLCSSGQWFYIRELFVLKAEIGQKSNKQADVEAFLLWVAKSRSRKPELGVIGVFIISKGSVWKNVGFRAQCFFLLSLVCGEERDGSNMTSLWILPAVFLSCAIQWDGRNPKWDPFSSLSFSGRMKQRAVRFAFPSLCLLGKAGSDQGHRIA